ncbi:MAG: hypothetical protein K1Y02_06980 [Candidatus Hydrogenedentes bacterium]|nr:hypothetical protein [Candidatus Hydrogenedentota bacterium]
MGPDIYSRIKDCLERQIAAYELMLNEYPSSDEADLDSDLEGILARQTEWTALSQDLQREMKVLFEEWQRNSTASAEQHSAIDALSSRVEEIAAQLISRNDAAVARIDQRLKEVGEELGRVRQNRITMGRYRPGKDEPGFMDKQI